MENNQNNQNTKENKENKENSNELNENKSFFGPNFRKWLYMKRQLRLVHEEIYTDIIHIPRIKYKVKYYDIFVYLFCLFVYYS